MKYKTTKRIIIDGLDGAGKSTLVEQLATAHEIKDIEHETSATPYPSKGYLKKLRKRRYILDRSFLSEMVYTQVFGRKHRKFSNHDEIMFLQEVVDSGVILIICINTPDGANEVFKERNEECDHDYIYASQLWHSLIKHLHKLGVPFHVYDLSEVKAGKEYEWLKNLND